MSSATASTATSIALQSLLSAAAAVPARTPLPEKALLALQTPNAESLQEFELYIRSYVFLSAPKWFKVSNNVAIGLLGVWFIFATTILGVRAKRKGLSPFYLSTQPEGTVIAPKTFNVFALLEWVWAAFVLIHQVFFLDPLHTRYYIATFGLAAWWPFFVCASYGGMGSFLAATREIRVPWLKWLAALRDPRAFNFGICANPLLLLLVLLPFLVLEGIYVREAIDWGTTFMASVKTASAASDYSEETILTIVTQGAHVWSRICLSIRCFTAGYIAMSVLACGLVIVYLPQTVLMLAVLQRQKDASRKVVQQISVLQSHTREGHSKNRRQSQQRQVSRQRAVTAASELSESATVKHSMGSCGLQTASPRDARKTSTQLPQSGRQVDREDPDAGRQAMNDLEKGQIGTPEGDDALDIDEGESKDAFPITYSAASSPTVVPGISLIPSRESMGLPSKSSPPVSDLTASPEEPFDPSGTQNLGRGPVARLKQLRSNSLSQTSPGSPVPNHTSTSTGNDGTAQNRPREAAEIRLRFFQQAYVSLFIFYGGIMGGAIGFAVVAVEFIYGMPRGQMQSGEAVALVVLRTYTIFTYVTIFVLYVTFGSVAHRFASKTLDD